ncbi:type IV pilus modification protein PilV [Marinobacter algicola]|jgi:type IV pilus assembly protein PilV|uniref:Type IV fimbrial biogenesis protein PilV n=1 Tax=Marinobacter algicola DG893 TaxID=443152 RepID=A6F490_9GAMM|nr:type IV pilus modification protein PilV [Marinobacter algicola]EDM46438.1 Type IV fimbrial biogenesis protein PilV [Marinobacter algicola DG893]
MKTNRIPDTAKSKASPASRSRGFTLIEILVTLFILAVGLLGLAGLMVDGMRNNQGAYLRTQASILAYDMADRMRANREEAENGGEYAGFSTTNASTTINACASAASGCTPEQQATVDKVQWTRQIQGAGSGMTLLPGGVGTIAHDAANDIFTIRISWDETKRAGDTGESVTDDNVFELSFSL